MHQSTLKNILFCNKELKLYTDTKIFLNDNDKNGENSVLKNDVFNYLY